MPMREIFCLVSILIPTFLFAQQAIDTSSIEEPKYDTTSIEIRSKNSFYFCSKLYKIVRDCDKKSPSNCCNFYAQIHLREESPRSGELACDEGTSLYWTYHKTEGEAKSTFNNYPTQIKRQMKKFEQDRIKLSISNQEAIAYKISFTSPQGFKGYEIIGYTTVNGQPVLVRFMSDKEPTSSTKIPPVFQQILQF